MTLHREHFGPITPDRQRKLPWARRAIIGSIVTGLSYMNGALGGNPELGEIAGLSGLALMAVSLVAHKRNYSAPTPPSIDYHEAEFNVSDEDSFILNEVDDLFDPREDYLPHLLRLHPELRTDENPPVYYGQVIGPATHS